MMIELDWRGESGYAQSELFLETEIEMIKQTNTVTKHMFFWLYNIY